MERIGLLTLLAVAGACRPAGESVEPSSPSVVIEPSSSSEAASPPVGPIIAAVEPTAGQTPPPRTTEPSRSAPAQIEPPTYVVRDSIWRESKTNRPPWERVSIADLRFGFPPDEGQAVTVLPLSPSLPRLQLRITRVVTQRGFPEDDIPTTWDAVLEPITERAYFDLVGHNPQFPADVVVVYPATPAATVIPSESISAEHLPAHAPPGSVKVAVDVDGDGRPDTVELTVCTDDPRQAECGEATAWETHRRVEGRWTLVHRFDPVT